jgi:hypothetical protein
MDAHYYLIGTDGRHHGPLTTDDVHTWLLDGRANRYSRARRDTEQQWRPLREMSEFEELTRPRHVGGGASAVADQHATDVVTALPTGSTAGLLDPLGCFRRAWSMLIRDFAALAGWALGAEALITLTFVIPEAGWLLVPVVDALLTAAVYVLYLGRMRGFRPSLRDVAISVGASAMPIVIANMAQFALLGVAVTLLGIGTATANGAATVTQPAAAVVGLLLVPPAVYLAVGYAFVVPLIVDKRLSVWEALEQSRRAVNPNWFRLFGLQMARGILLLLSAPTLGLGLVLTLPLGFAALMVAYRDLFPE